MGYVNARSSRRHLPRDGAVFDANGATVSFKYDPFGRRIYKSSSSDTSIYAVDPSGMLVFGVYYQSTGQLTLTDLNTGETVILNVESGGKPFGDPIPQGKYDILEQQRKPDEFRLDKQDKTPYDDVDDVTGRTHFRLHHPGRTIGCIAAKDWNDWNKAFNLINNTKTTTVPDNFKPWWKFWSSPGSLKDFGTVVVVP